MYPYLHSFNGVHELRATTILTCLETRFDKIAVIHRLFGFPTGQGNGLFQDRRVDWDSISFPEPELHLSSGMGSAGPGTFLETRPHDRNLVPRGCVPFGQHQGSKTSGLINVKIQQIEI